VYREGNTWTVAWFDSTHKRHYARGLPDKQLATLIGESQNFNRSAAKHGVIDRAKERQAREDERTLANHLTDFERSLKSTGRTGQYIKETRELVERVFAAAGIRKLSQLERFKIVRECDALMDKGSSRRTRNKALAACKAFIGWLRKNDRVPVNVLDREPMLDVEQDRRHVRKAATEEQVIALIETTATQPERGGMSGIDRMMRYALGFGTGFRQGTLFKLRPGDFHLDAEGGPFIHVTASNTKNRKAHDQPISRELADMLRPWLENKPASRPVFPAQRWANPMNAYRQDLKAAGIEYNADGSNEFCDLHAQRNAFITAVIRTAGLKVAQDLAHHSTPTLTSKYGRLGMSDYRQAVDALPKVKRGGAPDKKKNAG